MRATTQTAADTPEVSGRVLLDSATTYYAMLASVAAASAIQSRPSPAGDKNLSWQLATLAAPSAISDVETFPMPRSNTVPLGADAQAGPIHWAAGVKLCSRNKSTVPLSKHTLPNHLDRF